jgi:hypothetical protein
MLKHVLFASAALALLAAPSLAATGTVNVSGTVQPVCNMGYTLEAVAIGDITINPATAINTIQTKSKNLSQPGVTFCNTNTASMTVAVPALVGSVAPQNGSQGVQFTNLIPYSVTLPGGATYASSATATATTYPAPVGTFVQPVTTADAVTIVTAPAAGPVVAGDYSAIITITLTP